MRVQSGWSRPVYLALIVLVSFGALPGVASAQPSGPTGMWTTIDDATGKPRALVRITEVDGALEGAIVKIFLAPGEEPDPRCTACTDSRRDQPIVGMTFLSGLRKSPNEAVWTGGTILDPNNGKIYRSQATLSEDGRSLMVRGFIGIALLGRTQTWLRADP